MGTIQSQNNITPSSAWEKIERRNDKRIRAWVREAITSVLSRATLTTMALGQRVPTTDLKIFRPCPDKERVYPTRVNATSAARVQTSAPIYTDHQLLLSGGRVGSVVRALDWRSKGRRFESRQEHKKTLYCHGWLFLRKGTRTLNGRNFQYDKNEVCTRKETQAHVRTHAQTDTNINTNTYTRHTTHTHTTNQTHTTHIATHTYRQNTGTPTQSNMSQMLRWLAVGVYTHAHASHRVHVREFGGLWKHENNHHALVPPKNVECGCRSGGGIKNGRIRYPTYGGTQKERKTAFVCMYFLCTNMSKR